MMGSFFTREEFASLADQGKPVVAPYDPDAVQPASIDLRLGGTRYLYRLTSHVLGDRIDIDKDVERMEFNSIELRPHESAFVGLQEKIEIPKDALGFVFPRSSVTRLGVCISPVYMNPGYVGHMPITLVTGSPLTVTIVPGARVAQLVCFHLEEAPSRSYAEYEYSKYRDEDVSPCLMHSDRDISDVIKSILEQHAPKIMSN